VDANKFGCVDGLTHHVDGLMLTESSPHHHPLLHLSCTSYGPLLLLFRCIHTNSCSPLLAIFAIVVSLGESSETGAAPRGRKVGSEGENGVPR